MASLIPTSVAPQTAQSDVAGEHRLSIQPGVPPHVRYWPRGRVPVLFDDRITDGQRARFFRACAQWSAHANVACTAYAGERDFVRVSQDADRPCTSMVGANPLGGAAILNLGRMCWGGDVDTPEIPVTYQTIIHELGHLFGLWHEQQRIDRDQHISVHLENVARDRWHDFDIVPGYTGGGTAYDFASVMHYQPYQATTGTGPAFTVRPPFQGQPVGNVTVSALDGAELRKIYGAPRPEGLAGAPQLRMLSPCGQNPVTLAWEPDPQGPPASAYALRVGTQPGTAVVAIIGMGSQTTITAMAPTGVALYVSVGAFTPAGAAWSQPLVVFVP